MKDYEILEIRKIRHQVSSEHGHDIRELAEYYRGIEQELEKSGRYRIWNDRTSKTIKPKSNLLPNDEISRAS